MDNQKVLKVLNKALEHEMSIMVRYLHHSFIVTGPTRGPLVELFRSKVNKSAQQAIELGEKITALGGHPSVSITEIYEPGEQDIYEMLKEDLEEEQRHLDIYEGLLKEVKDHVALRAFLEQFIYDEQQDIDELAVYLRN